MKGGGGGGGGEGGYREYKKLQKLEKINLQEGYDLAWEFTRDIHFFCFGYLENWTLTMMCHPGCFCVHLLNKSLPMQAPSFILKAKGIFENP